MSLSSVFSRCRDILLRPKMTWQAIAAEPGGLKEAFIPYAVVMSLFPSLGMLLIPLVTQYFTSRLGVSSVGPSLAYSVKMAALYYVVGLVLTLIYGGVLSLIAPVFGGKRSLVQSCRILIYAATPIYVGFVLGIVPIVGLIFILGAIPWMLVLIYMGIGALLGTSGARQFLLTVTILGVYFVMGIAFQKVWPSFRYTPSTPVVQAGLPGDEQNQMIAQAKVSAGQGTEDEMAMVADQYLKAKIAAGEIKPGQEAEERKKMIEELRQMKAEQAKLAAEMEKNMPESSQQN